MSDLKPFPSWDQASAGSSELDKLIYRSRLLGSDLRLTNFGGGNTSAKIAGTDPLTSQPVSVLWVKGSGGDLGSISAEGFATLYQDKLLSLTSRYRGPEFEDEMVELFSYCAFGGNPRAPSIDTPIHGFIPYAHVDHVHPDDVIAIAACRDGAAVTKEIYGAEIGWMDWRRPGFELGLRIGKLATENPTLKGVVLGGHGLVIWADTSETCFERTIEAVEKARNWLARRPASAPFGEPRGSEVATPARAELVARLLPVLRGVVSEKEYKAGHFLDTPDVLEFVNSSRLEELAALGTSCPDHFLRTKRLPLLLKYDPATDDIETLATQAKIAVEQYTRDYAAYYRRNAEPDSPAMRDPYPVVVIIERIGIVCFALDKVTARIAAEFYVNAINVMRGAEIAGGYAGLAENEAFRIEYWALEEAKLRRMPPRAPLAGRVAYITGAAGGIGLATARRLLAEGAVVFLTDIDDARLSATLDDLADKYGNDRVRAHKVDVTDEALVAESYAALAREFGGVDIVVSNAGIASSAPFEATTLEMWNRNVGIMATGYFLVAREGFRQMQAQGRGGSIVFVASKNAMAASPNAAAYCTAKAAEVQLARCIALDGAAYGIRANVVNPDAVLSNSTIWQGEWAEQRASAYGVSVEALPDFYKSRSLLKQQILPEDVAEAILFFSSDRSAKSTGNILNVDGGSAAAFPR